MRDHLTFLLDGAVVRIRDISPTMTLLNWLRGERRLCGTKKGCAEGDCGACTVVIGEIAGDSVRYRAVNACILLMGQLEGRLVLTVEHVAAPNGHLHPVQKAIVDRHGSQCGFCTPGFVMSLYAAFLNGEIATRQSACDLLAGNLCRCTGYGGLLDATENVGRLERPEWDAARRGRDRAALAALRHDEDIDFSCNGQRLRRPCTVASLARMLDATPRATLVAGATDVGLWVTKQFRRLDDIIHIDGIAELTALSVDGDALWIGAGVRYADAHGLLGGHFADLGELMRRIGGWQVRNSGTIGGNIANGSPIGDMPPALIALGAELCLRRGPDERRIALESYFLDYGKQDRRDGEFLTGVRVPLDAQRPGLRCYKVSKRFDSDITAVLAAINVHVSDGRIARARLAFGGLAGIPKRAHAVERAMTGQPWTMATIITGQRALAEDFKPISDLRASAGYRMLVAQGLLEKYFLETTDATVASRLHGRAAAFS
jgi:xanthine dehydrogenase small subunit